MHCYCDSKKEFSDCCQPYLEGISHPSTPKQLMRSRYSAYVVGNGLYIVTTSIKENRHEDDVALIEEYAKSVEWLGLEILDAKEKTVEFKAYYKDSDGIKVQHEKSNFVYEDGVWLYRDGKIFNSKIERNAPCPCQSGKKYKKCCGS